MAPFEPAWQALLQRVELAKHYPDFFMIAGFVPGQRVRHPLLEGILPTVFFVNLLSLLDTALAAHIDKTLPSAKATRLGSRIELLSAKAAFHGNPLDLHRLRERRNEMAHNAASVATWAELDAALLTVAQELQHLGAIEAGERTPYTWHAERSGAGQSPDPNVLFQHRYSFGLDQGGRPVLRFGFTGNTLKADRD